MLITKQLAAVAIAGAFACSKADNASSAKTSSANLNQTQPASRGAGTAEWLADRAQTQRNAIKKFNVFSDFKFTDRLPQSGITFVSQVVRDAAIDFKPAHYDHGTGIVAADVDGDGRIDIYFISQLGGNELWRNLGVGKSGQVEFENITQSAGVGLKGRVCVGAAFADVDNNGTQDLFVTTTRGGNVLLLNDGKGHFRDVSKEAGVDHVGHSSGVVFFDFDRDGLLDLFVTNVGRFTSDKKRPEGNYVALDDAFSGHLFPERFEQSILYKNLGDHRFKDVTREMGLGGKSWSGDATALDINQDGYPDLYLTNMQGDDILYVNDRGAKFHLATDDYFPKTPWGAMGVKAFDFNNDGLLDLFVTDMHSDMQYDAERETEAKEKAKTTAANRDPAFTEASLGSTRKSIGGNAFYLNRGQGKFEEVSDRINAETFWPWGVSIGDLNADGYDDAFIAAGMGYPFRYAGNNVLLNDEGRRFVDAEFVVGAEPRRGGRTVAQWFTLDCNGADRQHSVCQRCASGAPPPPNLLRTNCNDRDEKGHLRVYGSYSTRSAVVLDIDGDGALDIVTGEHKSEPQLLISDLARRKPIHFIKIALRGTKSNANGLGAKVTVHVNQSMTLTKWNDGKSGYLSQSVLPLYFGLGANSNVESINVRWPSGRETNLKGPVAGNRLLEVIEN
jgi:hypothetical protein